MQFCEHLHMFQELEGVRLTKPQGTWNRISHTIPPSPLPPKGKLYALCTGYPCGVLLKNLCHVR